MDEPNCMLDVLKMKFPDLPIEKNAMVVDQEYLINSPLDWLEFVMVTVHRQRHTENVHLVCLDDDETAQAFEILTDSMIPVYVYGHPVLKGPKGEDAVWMAWVLKHKSEESGEEDTRLWSGGTHLRQFCDHHNLYYRTSALPDGKLISVADCLTLKVEGDDCAKPVGILTEL